MTTQQFTSLDEIHNYLGENARDIDEHAEKLIEELIGRVYELARMGHRDSLYPLKHVFTLRSLGYFLTDRMFNVGLECINAAFDLGQAECERTPQACGVPAR